MSAVDHFAGRWLINKRTHDRRVRELLEANNALLERARAAEAERDDALAQVEAMARRIDRVQADVLREALSRVQASEAVYSMRRRQGQE